MMRRRGFSRRAFPSMPHISATRLRLRRLRFLPAFLRATEAVVVQMRTAPGFLGGRVLVERRLTFWTWSAWNRGDDMRAFRDAGAHRAAMPGLAEWCDEASVVHWLGETPADWAAVHGRMAAEGRASRVKHPARAHDEFDIAAPRPWLPERVVAPVSIRTDSSDRAAG
jgi:hypothetical protein